MKTIKLYKKYKRLDGGGVTPNQQFSQGVGYGNTALQVANIGNQMFGDQGNEFGVKDDFASTAGGALSGAASGAAMGSMLGPWGTLGGAAIGGVAGAIKAGKTNKEAKERQALYEEQRKQLLIQNSRNQWQQTLNNGFQVQGNMNAQKYAKNGGLLYKKMSDGGKFKPSTELKSDNTKVLKKYELPQKFNSQGLRTNLVGNRTGNEIKKDFGKSGTGEIEESVSPLDVAQIGYMGIKAITKAPSLIKSLAKTSQKSSLDWGKWNSEIPSNKPLIKEYNQIEKNAKKSGTWMKNPDGSAFKGTPEQFVQQNSENFKKAFGNSKLVNPDGSPTIQYHGSAKKFNTFDENKFQSGDSGYSGQGIYTTPSKTTANSYATSSAKFHKGDIEPTVYELYGQANNPISSSQLIKENKGRDLFNFHRKKNWKGDLTPEESLMDYDAAIADQLPNVESIRPWNDAREIVFPTNKQLKSAVGNNGMFDMNNPNIYKSLAPVGVGVAISKYKEKEMGGFIYNSQNKKSLYKHGGNVQKLSKTNVQFNGNSHENGGIKEPLVNGVKLNEVEVEGNESMSTSNGQKFVFSENLGFAQQHKPLAKAMGKIEKYLKSNPNDPIRKRTLNSLKEREEQLKVKQEETKEALGLENNLGEMRLGGAIKRKDGVYMDREGVMKYPLKNGGMVKYGPGGNVPDDPMLDPNYFGNFSPETRNVQDYTSYGGGPGSYTNTLDNLNRNKSLQMQLNMQGAKNVSGKNKGKSLTVDGYIGDNSKWAMVNTNLPKNSGTMISGTQSMSPYNYKSLPNASVLGGSNLNPSASVRNSNVGGPNSLEGLPGKGATGTTSNGSKMNWGNLAGKIIPYAGVAANYMLNEKARNMTTPKEALPDYVKYKPVDYSASKIEADQQRRQLNKDVTQNVTNSAVAAALKAKNLGTTIGAKNLINQEETNVNTEGVNIINLVNNQIQQRRNQIDTENRDRDYNKEQRYLTQKGEIVNNASSIYQNQMRDRNLNDLENRKIDILSKYDANRGVHEAKLKEEVEKQKDATKKNGGFIKKSGKLYNKLKK